MIASARRLVMGDQVRPPNTMSDKTMRVETLTFFRFMAAVIVVIFHYGGATGLGGVLSSGPQMVTFFFVLSGFVMGISYYNKKKVVAKSYWWARVSRIMPVYLLALFLTVVFLYSQNENINHEAALLDLVLLQAWVTPYPIMINSPGWSLSAEMFFYFSFPFILKIINWKNISNFRLLFISLMIWLVTQGILSFLLSSGYYKGFPSNSHDLIFYFPLFHFCSFLLGVAGGIWFVENNEIIDARISSLMLVTSIVILFFLLTYPFIAEYHVGFKLAFSSSFLSPFFLLFIISISMCKYKIMNIFSTWPLILLGEASFSIYILQMPVHQFYNRYFIYLKNNSPMLDFYVYLSILITLAIVLFLFFEKPVNKFLRFSMPKMITNRGLISLYNAKVDG